MGQDSAARGLRSPVAREIPEIVPSRGHRTSRREIFATRYRLPLDLIRDGVVRVAFTPPIPVNLPDNELAAAILDCGSVAECNAAFARRFGGERADDLLRGRPDRRGSRIPRRATGVHPALHPLGPHLHRAQGRVPRSARRDPGNPSRRRGDPGARLPRRRVGDLPRHHGMGGSRANAPVGQRLCREPHGHRQRDGDRVGHSGERAGLQRGGAHDHRLHAGGSGG